VQVAQDDQHVTQVRRYKVITPLFGGGVDPAKADPVTVVRATEIRGHLRFWWRATRGGQFGADGLKEMREAEASIWGSAANDKSGGASKVKISIQHAPMLNRLSTIETVVITRKGKQIQVPINSPESPYSYVAFPLRGTDNKSAGKLLSPGFEFSIRIDIDGTQDVIVNDGHQKLDLQQEVEAALWAWETFGGIGARTRRGFGALQLVSIQEDAQITAVDTPSCQTVDAWLQKRLQQHQKGSQWPDGVPHLVTVKTTSDSYKSASKAWEDLIKKLKSFRQDPLGRREKRPGDDHPGRSYWPEPEAIRHLTGQRASKHPPLNWQVYKFPRAVFGLPIIFHFKDKDDPKDTTLKGQSYERWASPLILRPLACKNNQAVGLAVLLEPTPLLAESQKKKDLPDSIVLSGDRETFPVQIGLSSDDAKKIRTLNGNPDVLQAFLDTL
jgi:CRISPR-associated protein Cmr1